MDPTSIQNRTLLANRRATMRSKSERIGSISFGASFGLVCLHQTHTERTLALIIVIIMIIIKHFEFISFLFLKLEPRLPLSLPLVSVRLSCVCVCVAIESSAPRLERPNEGEKFVLSISLAG